MSGKVPREFIDDLLVRIDIIDLINSHVPLKKKGSSYTARCPFHTEKTPSFSVSRSKQFYHCFGCGAGGNAISFLMEYSHLDFIEAIEDLAGFIGIDVPREATSKPYHKQNYSSLYSILEKTAVFYIEQLRTHPQGKIVIQYLKNRGLSGKIAKQYSLGFAPNDWNSLTSRFENKLLLDSGMIIRKDDGLSFDRFRGRLIFPIKDRRQRIIGFGGRVLDDSLPKYLNSPETVVFSKSKELYGLPELLEKNSKPKRILVVEGYMDVLMLAEFGINYSVAALGTATSKAHLDLLFRFTPEIVFCFDGDKAGIKAAWRAVQGSFASLKDGRAIKVMLLPQGEDPDSLISAKGKTHFENLIQNSQTLSDYFFSTISEELNLHTVEGKAILATQALPCIEKIPTGFFRNLMLEELERLAPKSAANIQEYSPPIATEQIKKQYTQNSLITPERTVLALLLQNPEMTEIVEEISPDWDQISFPSKEWLLDILFVIESKQLQNTGGLLETYRGNIEKEKMLFMLANLNVFPLENQDFDLKNEFKGALIRVLKQGTKKYQDELLDKKLGK